MIVVIVAAARWRSGSYYYYGILPCLLPAHYPQISLNKSPIPALNAPLDPILNLGQCQDLLVANNFTNVKEKEEYPSFLSAKPIRDYEIQQLPATTFLPCIFNFYCLRGNHADSRFLND